MSTELEQLLKLGRAEKIQLVEDLWDSIAAESEQFPISAQKVEELRARKEQFEKNPESGFSLEEVKMHARSSKQ